MQHLMDKKNNLVDLFFMRPYNFDTSRIDEIIKKSPKVLKDLNPSLTRLFPSVELTKTDEINEEYLFSCFVLLFLSFKPNYGSQYQKWFVKEQEIIDSHIPSTNLLKIAYDKPDYFHFLPRQPPPVFLFICENLLVDAQRQRRESKKRKRQRKQRK
jgi:hypothetical protein